MNVVLNPVFVPPFDWIHLDAVDLHGEVKMIATSQARGTRFAHALAALHRVAFFHREFAQVAIDRLKTVAVIYNDAIAVDAERRGPYYSAIISRDDGRVL